jgi:hypothetical protein
VNLLGDNIEFIKRNTEALIDDSKEVGIEINVEKTKYLLVSRGQNADRNRDRKIGNKSFENVSQLKHLGTTVTNQNVIRDEIKRRLNSGNACYHSVKNLSVCSSAVKICKDYNIQDHNFLPWFCMGVKLGL